MTNVNTTFAALPIATSLTGAEILPVDQGGTTKQTTAGAIGALASVGQFTSTFITVTANPILVNSRIISVSTNLSLTDGGALGNLTIGTGALSGDVTSAANSFVTTVVKINGVALGATTATAGNILIASGTQWVTQAIIGDISLTAGGSVTVGAINGSTLGITTPTAANLLIGSGTQWVSHGVTGDISITSAGAVAVNSVHSGVFANPTALVGLTTVNGGATTAMRSDASPALDVAILPSWTGQHQWTGAPVYNLAANVLATPILIPLNNAAQTVAANKEFNYLRFSQSGGSDVIFTIGANGVAAGLFSSLTSGVGSDATSNLYGAIMQATNNGAGTTKAVHGFCAAGAGSTGVCIVYNAQMAPVATSGYTAGLFTGGSGADDKMMGVGIEGGGARYLLGVGSALGPVKFSAAAYRAWMATGSAATARAFQVMDNAGAEIAFWSQEGRVVSQTNSASALAVTATGAGANVGATITNNSSTGNASVLFNTDAGLIGGFFAIGSGGAASFSGPNTLNLGTTGAFGLGLSVNSGQHLYMSTAGGVFVGTTQTDAGANNFLGSGSIKSNSASAGVGYAPGSGSNVTQLTNRNTGVTINNVTGSITLVSTIGSATPATCVVSNTTTAPSDTVLVGQKSGTDKYTIGVTAISSQGFSLTFFTSGATTESPVFNFAVIKGSSV